MCDRSQAKVSITHLVCRHAESDSEESERAADNLGCRAATRHVEKELHICEPKKPCHFRARAAPPLPPPPGPWLVAVQSQHRVLESVLAALCLEGRRVLCALCTGLPAWGLWWLRQRPSMPPTAVGLGHFPPARQVRSGEYALSACQSVFISHHAGNMAALERAGISVSLVRLRVAASFRVR
jgi:hypothetical protein